LKASCTSPNRTNNSFTRTLKVAKAGSEVEEAAKLRDSAAT
jgi:hypothetical protein